MIEPREPTIIINGVPLSVGQAMTVRVALQIFAINLQEDGMKKDMGDIGAAYLSRIREINGMMIVAGRQQP